MDTASAVIPTKKKDKVFTELVGARIAFVREGLGLTQTAVAKRAGLSVSHMCHIEKGERSIDVEKLLTLARVLNCKVNDFIPTAEGGTPLAKSHGIFDKEPENSLVD